MENEKPRILVLLKARIREFSFCGKREFCFCGKRESAKMAIGEFSFCGKSESENSRFVENENPRILVLWKTRIREFSFCGT